MIGDPAGMPPVTGSRNVYHIAKSNKTTATALRQTADRTARAFCTASVGLLKNYLGTQWNSQWQAAGFTNGSLAIPDDTLPMLGELGGYFRNMPAHENAVGRKWSRSSALSPARLRSDILIRASQSLEFA